MSQMERAEGYRVAGRREEACEAEGYVKEFTRHAGDVLLNLNELRRRGLLTDATLLVGPARLRAHRAVLIACSGFFYSLYSRRMASPGRGGGGGPEVMTLSLPSSLDPPSVALLLDFMYTSRLPLSRSSAPGVLAAAAYLRMDHVAEACRAFMMDSESTGVTPPRAELDCGGSPAAPAPQGGAESNALTSTRTPRAGPGPTGPPQPAAEGHTGLELARVPAGPPASLKPGTFLPCQPRSQQLKLGPDSPRLGSPTPSDSPSRSSLQPNSPSESNTCTRTSQHRTEATPTPDPKACNWKKYKYIVLNPLCAVTTVKEEEPVGHAPHSDRLEEEPQAWPGEALGQTDRQGQAPSRDVIGRVLPPAATPLLHPHRVDSAPAAAHEEPNQAQPIKRESYCLPFCYPGHVGGAKPTCTGEKPYQCSVCGAQFNRPANLKTHARIHSGEKPYRCDTCGARFVQVAHLRAHVLIHTGEKPYPCHTCGTRFRHLQTLKSHLRIHTGEKPYTCEQCDLHFRHKSQLRLHLRQRHGAVTNTKVRYQVLSDPYQLTPDPYQPALQAY